MSKDIKPFLKWAGGKYQLRNRIGELLPPGRRFIEPMAGAAAVFLNTNYEENWVNDINEDLINLFETLKVNGLQFIKDAQKYFSPKYNNEAAYYKLRDQFNASSDLYERAIMFVYLNKHGYNGLCRYNQDGIFNVPFGRYNNPKLPEMSMREFYKRSENTRFTCLDFEKVMSQAESGDVVYCDPPYIPISDTANFTSYAKESFGVLEQERLARAAESAAANGATVLLSNHDTSFIQRIYKNAKISSFEVSRTISCVGSNRKPVMELLALFEPELAVQSA